MFGFGYQVAIDGDTIVVGAHKETSTTTSIINGSNLSATDTACVDNGAVYVFVRSGSTWTHQAYLKALNNSNSDLFGESVAIEGNTIVVGARQEDSNTSGVINSSNLSATNDLGADNGAVYVYTRSGGSWSFQAYLKAPNTSNNDYFGKTVAISGNTIVVGAYQEQSSTNNIIPGSDFSVTDDALQSGAAYVFTRSGTTWSHQAYLKAPNPSMNDRFALSVDIDGDTIVVGAKDEASSTSTIINGNNLSGTDDAGASNGAAYVYYSNGSTWVHQAYLKAPNNSSNDEFARQVAISNDTTLVGSLGERSNTSSIITGSDLSSTDDAGINNGAACAFMRKNNSWEHVAHLKAPNVNSNVQFGHTVALDLRSAVVGASYQDSSTTSIIHGSDLGATDIAGTDNGAVYIFR